MIGAGMTARQFIERSAEEVLRLDHASLERLAASILQRHRTEGTVFIIGNGGSASSASHLAEDLGKGSLRREDFDDDKKRRLRVISLADSPAYLLAWGNDEGFDRVFLEQLKNLARPGDLLIAISGSGNSPNVLRAVEWANRHGVDTFGVTGFCGGSLRKMAGDSFHVDLLDMGLVESLHLVGFHWIVDEMHRQIGHNGAPRSNFGLTGQAHPKSSVITANQIQSR